MNRNSKFSFAQLLALGGLSCAAMCVCVVLAGVALSALISSPSASIAPPLSPTTRAAAPGVAATQPAAAQAPTLTRATLPTSSNPAPAVSAGKSAARAKKIRALIPDSPCMLINQASAVAALGEAVKGTPVTQIEDDDFASCGYDARAPTTDVFRGVYVLVYTGDAAKAEYLQSIKDLRESVCGAGVAFGKTQTPDGLANLAGKSLAELAAMEQQLFRDQCSGSGYSFQVAPGIGDAAEFKTWQSGATLDVVVDDVLLRFALLKTNADRAKALAGLTTLAQQALEKAQ